VAGQAYANYATVYAVASANRTTFRDVLNHPDQLSSLPAAALNIMPMHDYQVMMSMLAEWDTGPNYSGAPSDSEFQRQGRLFQATVQNRCMRGF